MDSLENTQLPLKREEMFSFHSLKMEMYIKTTLRYQNQNKFIFP